MHACVCSSIATRYVAVWCTAVTQLQALLHDCTAQQPVTQNHEPCHLRVKGRGLKQSCRETCGSGIQLVMWSSYDLSDNYCNLLPSIPSARDLFLSSLNRTLCNPVSKSRAELTHNQFMWDRLCCVIQFSILLHPGNYSIRSYAHGWAHVPTSSGLVSPPEGPSKAISTCTTSLCARSSWLRFNACNEENTTSNEHSYLLIG